MRHSSLCFVCGGVAEPAFTCSMCGLIICPKCFDKNTKLCKFCTRKMNLVNKT